MADRKISDLTALTAPAAGDYLPIVDISEASAANKNKRITIEELLRGAPDGTAAAPSIGFESDPNTGIYRPGADQLAISTGGTGRLFVDSSGRVGIGGSPATTLDVNGDVTITDKIIHGGDTNTAIRFPAADTVSVETGGTERARIDSSGRLLVGTSSARTVAGNASTPPIQVETAGNTAAIQIVANPNTNAGPVIFFGKSRGGVLASNTIVQSGDTIGSLQFCGADGVNMDSLAAQIAVQVDGTPGASDMPGRLVFSTTADGASSPTERLRITSAGVVQVADAGNIAVGTTTGTKIGTATTQKLGFFNATPVVQPTAVADATDAASVITQLNALLTRMRTLGLIAT